MKKPLPPVDKGRGEKRVNESSVSGLAVKYDLTDRQLKPDSSSCPLMIGDIVKKYYNKESGKKSEKDYEEVLELFLETFSPNFKDAYEFIVIVAEPNSRQEFIQTYHLKPASLFSAITFGFSAEYIVQKLGEFNKFDEVSLYVKKFITENASSFGKCRLLLQGKKYFLESESLEVLEYYRRQKVLSQCWDGEPYRFVEDADDIVTNLEFGREQLLSLHDNSELYKKLEEMIKSEERKEAPKTETYRLGILHQYLDLVRIEREDGDRFKYMLSQEYDYKADDSDPLPVSLRPTTRIRSYQEKALNRIFVKNRARSGIVVLPCGAGKTLLGICCMTQMRKHTLIICINNMTVNQWCNQITFFTEIDRSRIFKFISEENQKNEPPDLTSPCIVVSTYTMISRNDELRGAWAKKFMEKISAIEWGLLLLDEVQVAPAEMFKRAFLTKTKSHTKIGLTATLVREDNKIEDLLFYIGPKLYEESWIELTKQGFLASCRCIEIRTKMPEMFKREYEIKREGDFARNLGMYLYTANPNKFIVLQYLITLHRAMGHKILIFIDTIDVLVEFATRLKYPFIIGQMSNFEREQILRFFKQLPDWSVLFVSRVGDVGIDIPDANVAIEVSSQFGSRRQEAQRLGRILRPKEKRMGDSYQSYFYSLVSMETEETIYAMKRQKFLIKQGYSFQVENEEDFIYNKEPERRKDFKLTSRDEQLEYLNRIMSKSANNEAQGPKAALKRNAVEGPGTYAQF